MSVTVLDRLVDRLRSAAGYNHNAYAAPVAVLWPDEAGHWQPVIDRLAEELPIVTLGEFDLAARRGPAYWVRCVVAGTYPFGFGDAVPIVYLPGVSRSELRAADTCREDLAPIAELQYRSQWFSHPNGRDWTVRSLLTHADAGLGLQIVDSQEAKAALVMALDHLLRLPVEQLEDQLLTAAFFNHLVNPDPVETMLEWLDDPSGFRNRLDAAQLAAFVKQSKAEFGVDPDADGEIVAAGRLAARQGAWAQVWKRFRAQPERYRGVGEQLRRARPETLIIDDRDAWPQENENGEDQLRAALHDFQTLTPSGARAEINRLENDHSWRRATVWADLGAAPLAFALEQLALLTEITATDLPAADVQALRVQYEQQGWRADDAVLRALGAVDRDDDRAAVGAAVRAVYLQWLDSGADRLQEAIGPMVNSGTYVPDGAAGTEAGVVTVFVDGLRLDVARRIEAQLSELGLELAASTSLAALPTVTETAKPVLVPAKPGSLGAGPDLHAANSVSGTKATIGVLRSLMTDNGVQVLAAADTGDPTGTAWTEAGQVDHRGHDFGARLVDHLDGEVRTITERIRQLLAAGWRRVEVVTDHGWILVPGGMKKAELKPSTTELKKGRCARLKDGAVASTPVVPWNWDHNVRIALAPGATCFEANKEYEHGGVSPQECFVPRLSVSTGATSEAATTLAITEVKWLGLLCRVRFEGAITRAVVDLRALPADASTSIAEEAKETQTTGKVSLVVPDEDLDCERAYLVVVGPDGAVIAQREVTVGRNR